MKASIRRNGKKYLTKRVDHCLCLEDLMYVYLDVFDYTEQKKTKGNFLVHLNYILQWRGLDTVGNIIEDHLNSCEETKERQQKLLEEGRVKITKWFKF